MNFINEIINNLVTDFSFRKVGVLVGVCIAFFFLVATFESYTSFFVLNKTEKVIHLTQELSKLPEWVIEEEKAEIRDTAKAISNTLNNISNNQQISISFLWLIKFICVAIPWLLTAITLYLADKNTEGVIYSGLSLVTFISYFVSLVPVSSWQLFIWPNYWAYPLIQFVVVFIILLIASKIQNTNKSKQSDG
jgi:hypothetical protein